MKRRLISLLFFFIFYSKKWKRRERLNMYPLILGRSLALLDPPLRTGIMKLHAARHARDANANGIGIKISQRCPFVCRNIVCAVGELLTEL
jgi:hypothetical protein